ncbi:hypothetical protein LXL04_005970 [Taraxacum kok-saghyz]
MNNTPLPPENPIVGEVQVVDAAIDVQDASVDAQATENRRSKIGTKHLHEHYKKCIARKTKAIKKSNFKPRQEKKEGSISLNACMFDQSVSKVEIAKMMM